jgi:hypothetical protein
MFDTEHDDCYRRYAYNILLANEIEDLIVDIEVDNILTQEVVE